MGPGSRFEVHLFNLTLLGFAFLIVVRMVDSWDPGHWAKSQRGKELGPRTLIGNGDDHMGTSFKEAALHWRFGPDWPGIRCGAKTRAGPPCKKPAMRGKARCQLHGGKSTGARTTEGLAKLSALHWKHGRCTKAAKAEAKRRAQVGREIRSELRDIERDAIAAGTLARAWRDQFK